MIAIFLYIENPLHIPLNIREAIAKPLQGGEGWTGREVRRNAHVENITRCEREGYVSRVWKNRAKCVFFSVVCNIRGVEYRKKRPCLSLLEAKGKGCGAKQPFA